jgi:uncharacterized protein
MTALPALIKVFAIFTLIVLLNRSKLDLGLSILIGSFLLGLWFGLGPDVTLTTMAKSLIEPMTLMLILLVSLILFLNQLMEKCGSSKRMVESFALMARNLKVSLVSLPALIGLLPMPGGAYFSAPMIGHLTQNTLLTQNQKTLINYWFRHIWEFWWPMYPGVIMALSISGVNPGTYIPIQMVYTLFALITGYFLILRRLPAHQPVPDDTPHDFHGNARIFIKNAMPVIIILFFMGVLSATENLWAQGTLKGGEMIKYLPMFIGMGLAILWVIVTEHFGPRTLAQAIFNKKILMLLLLVIGIMAYKKVLTVCGAIHHMDEEFRAFHIPLLPIVILLPFISGLVLAVALGFVGASFPLVISLVGQRPDYAAWISMAYAAGYVGMMLSPVHMCLVLTKNYFEGSTFWGIYKALMPLCAAVFVFALAWFFVLRGILG